MDRNSELGHRTRRDPSVFLQLVVHPAEVMRSLAARLQVTHLLTRYSERPIWALFMLLNGFITIALLAAVAMVSRTPVRRPSSSHSGS